MVLLKVLAQMSSDSLFWRPYKGSLGPSVIWQQPDLEYFMVINEFSPIVWQPQKRVFFGLGKKYIFLYFIFGVVYETLVTDRRLTQTPWAKPKFRISEVTWRNKESYTRIFFIFSQKFCQKKSYYL